MALNAGKGNEWKERASVTRFRRGRARLSPLSVSPTHQNPRRAACPTRFLLSC